MSADRELLESLRASGAWPGHAVRHALASLTDPATARQAGRILATLSPEGQDARPVRVAVRATGTVGPFEPLLRTSLVAAGVAPALEVGGYRAFALPAEGADVVACLIDDGYFLPREWSPLDPAGLAEVLRARLAELRALVLAGPGDATVVLHTVPLPSELRDTVISLRARSAVCRAWHELNAGILALTEEDARIVVVDLAGELADTAVRARDERLHRYADLPYTDGALLVLARRVARVVAGGLGLSRKVLAVDLDNTLWGGVLGEVGVAGLEIGGLYPGNCYRHLQSTVERLRQQGVTLVLASKNDAAPVDEALADHPEVVLRPDMFAVRAVNWSPKPGNLREAAARLNLSTEAFAFLDDSPFERGQVAAELPEVAVLAADGDPAYLSRELLRRGLFDVAELTDTDRRRPELYRSRALRTDFSAEFSSSEDYLRELGIVLHAAPATPFEVQRVAQLSLRTNQFNLTGARFDLAATTALRTSPGHLVASFAVSDRFGDEGIVGAAWIERGGAVWTVLNLVLSCRVFGRGVEFAMADWILCRARDAGATTVTGRYLPTNRNGVAAAFWEKAGFSPSGVDGEFTADLAVTPTPLPTWISYGATT